LRIMAVVKMASSFESVAWKAPTKTVVAVSSNAKSTNSVSPLEDAVNLVKDHGAEGDAHAGRFMQPGYLAKNNAGVAK